ncbi:MAG: hypothetical protein K9N47_19385 [Prosthecobacter sp.]|uniref:hypothetical protein n=1 Tax=Prosthecobacter sp. TaxID=1965333 RepID=UPI0025E4BF22|nr:hypothetical protein [Prosthecobacter sp.]MCF7788295.1 hypothetical protein [Prosthecobacter sp.]
MPCFTGFEYGILILGLCLLLTGTEMIFHHTEMDVSRPESAKLSRPATFEHVSKRGVAAAGGFSALAGIGFLAAQLCRRAQ